MEYLKMIKASNTPRSSHSTTLPAPQTRLIPTTRLPGADDQIHNMFHALPVLDDRKHRRAALAHPRCIALHHAQIGTHRLRKIDLVDDQQIAARDSRAPFARHLVTAGHVDDVDDEVGEFARIIRGEIIAAGLDQQ